jgi:hypothetical protein
MKKIQDIIKKRLTVMEEYIPEAVDPDEDDIEWDDEDFAEFEDGDEEIDFDPAELEQDIETFTWDDILDMYGPEELEDEDEVETSSFKPDDHISEGLSVAQRMKKKLVMRRHKKRIGIARKIKLKRASSSGVLKQRAVRKARQLVTKRLLRGRDKSKMSASEKSAIEARVKRMKSIVQRTAKRLTPTMRKIERARLSR